MPRLKRQTLQIAKIVEAIYDMDDKLTAKEQQEAVRSLSGMSRKEMAKFVSKYFSREDFPGLDPDIKRGLSEGRLKYSDATTKKHTKNTWKNYR